MITSAEHYGAVLNRAFDYVKYLDTLEANGELEFDNRGGGCAACHVTGGAVAYNDTSGEWTASWEEMGVACEACHGPGSTHTKPPQGERKVLF